MFCNMCFQLDVGEEGRVHTSAYREVSLRDAEEDVEVRLGEGLVAGAAVLGGVTVTGWPDDAAS